LKPYVRAQLQHTFYYEALAEMAKKAANLGLITAADGKQYATGFNPAPELLAIWKKNIASAEAEMKFRAAPSAAPASVDWRSNGGDFTTPAKDQGTCNSCTAYALMGVIESRCKIFCKSTSATLNLSEAHLFARRGNVGCAQGWHPTDAIAFLEQDGAGKEDAAFQISGSSVPGFKPFTAIVNVARRPDVNATDDKKSMLAQKGPLVGGMEIYNDLINHKTGTYRPGPGAQFLGRHNIMVGGYDSQGWIIKNSWGPGWGNNNGWFRLAYGACGIDTKFPFWDLSVTAAPCTGTQPTDPPPEVGDCDQYVPELKTTLKRALERAGLKAALREAVCDGATPTSGSPAENNIAVTTARILKDCAPKYKKWFCSFL
jgi:C1A family cysteine protease